MLKAILRLKTRTVLGALVLAACNDSAVATMETPPKNGPQLTGALSNIPDHVAGARRSEELAAIEELIARMPPEHRERARTLLAKGAVAVTSADPEIARLWSTIASIRQADFEARRRSPVTVSSTSDSQAVIVALVNEVPIKGARAVIIRRPDDGGVPTVLLSERDASAEDLFRAVRVSTSTRLRKLGESIRKEIRFALRRTTASASPASIEPKWGVALADLRSQAEQELPQIGKGRAIILRMPKSR